MNDDVPAFAAMVTDGLSLFVGENDVANQHSPIVRYALDGQYRDIFANLPCQTDRCTILALERDGAGNFYATTGNDDFPPYGDPWDHTVFRISPTGIVQVIYTTPSNTTTVWGVDADVHGQIYVAQRDQISSLTP